jgi:undecaprenyl-diphosphatase
MASQTRSTFGTSLRLRRGCGRTPRPLLIAFFLSLCALASVSPRADAGGGPLGIDHRLSKDDSGIWQRSNQWALLYATAASVSATALWEGGETRIGKTSWQAVDAAAMGVASSEALKRVFSRERPAVTDDPNRWFAGGTNRSFPSTEVTAMAALITPYVLEYRHEQPAVYALELLPLYDAIGRVKVQGHWQSDVLAGYALGTAAGYFAHSFHTPLFLSVLPHGFTVGLKANF